MGKLHTSRMDIRTEQRKQDLFAYDKNGKRKGYRDGDIRKVYTRRNEPPLYTNRAKIDNLITWKVTEEGSDKQIDYMLIRNMQGNRAAQVHAQGTANTEW